MNEFTFNSGNTTNPFSNFNTGGNIDTDSLQTNYFGNDGLSSPPTNPSIGGTPAVTTGDGFNFLGQGGALDLGIQGVGIAGNAFLGYQANQLAKRGLKQADRQFNLNFDASAKDYNRNLEDTQRTRLAAQGVTGAALEQQLAPYLDQHRIKA